MIGLTVSYCPLNASLHIQFTIYKSTVYKYSTVYESTVYKSSVVKHTKKAS